MELVNDFGNKLVSEITSRYFVGVLSREELKYSKMKYTIECFSNGCLTYDKLINTLSKMCKESKANIHNLVSTFVKDFAGYEYKIIQ